MAERIKFLSPEEKQEKEITETLQSEGGIFYREEISPETGEKKSVVNILGVEVETYASKEDIEEIKKEIVLSEFDQKLLRDIAECYKLHQPLMFEGDPGAGKTFLMEKFVKLVHGKETPILKLVGTPRTSELEILGHWAPAVKKEESKDPLTRDAVRRYEKLEKEYQEAGEDFDKKYAQIKEQRDKEKINKDNFQKQLTELQKWYQPLQERYATELELLFQKTKEKTEWEFKEGALLQAYSGRDGKGYILICDEFNLIPSNYQQAFLQIGGEKGQLSESISFWGNSGKTIYNKGEDTAILFASNYPEKTPGRSEVVAPMTDRLVWRTLTSEEVEEKKKAIKRTAGGRLGKRARAIGIIKPERINIPAKEQMLWDEVLDGTLGEQIADTVDILDEDFVKTYEQIGDSLEIKGEKRKRTQQMEFSARNALKLYSYLDQFQVRNPETGLVDFTKTLKNAFEKYYLNRLANSDAREKAEESFDKILGLSITPQELESIKKSEDILKAEGKGLPLGVALFEGKILTRKEIFDILVERLAKTKEEEKEKPEEKESDEKFNKESRELNELNDALEKELEELEKDIAEECKL